MEKLEQLYEGKAKKVFKTGNADQLIVDYKDDATAFNGAHGRKWREQQPHAKQSISVVGKRGCAYELY